MGFLILIILASFLVHLLSSNYLGKHEGQQSSYHSCPKTFKDIQVVLKGNQAIPDHISGKLCDSLTFTNRDNAIRLIAFGPHDHHAAYDGITSETLDTNQSLKIVLNQVGNFEFHDHLLDVIKGTFTVSN